MEVSEKRQGTGPAGSRAGRKTALIEERKKTVERLKTMGHEAGCVLRFTILFSSFMSRDRDYGIGEKLTFVEIATLQTICSESGITPTGLARKWRKTKGAVSHLLKALEEKQLIVRRQEDGNMKTQYLYPTELGKSVIDRYEKIDIDEVPVIYEEMHRNHTDEEIATFYRVMNTYSEILSEVL